MSYEANEKLDALQEVMRLLERTKDEIAGMQFVGIECDIEDLISSVSLEIDDLQDAVKEEDDIERAAELRDYYRSVY